MAVCNVGVTANSSGAEETLGATRFQRLVAPQLSTGLAVGNLERLIQLHGEPEPAWMEPANASKGHVAIQGFLRLASPFPQISQIFGDQNDVTVESAFRNRFFEVINATFQQS